MPSPSSIQHPGQRSSDPAEQSAAAARVVTGRVFLVSDILKNLRSDKLQSQEEMAFACSDQKIRVSIASIKRAETGKPVIYRVARELARYFNVPVQQLIREERPPGAAS
jgi:DNA-binding XRE family transcriptional regulator